jgi:cytochrome c553
MHHLTRRRAVTSGAAGFLCALLAVLVATPLTNADDEQLPDWAHPTPGPVRAQTSPDVGQLHRVPGSSLTFTDKQIENPLFAKDWFPDEHPPMPPIVVGAEDAKVSACASCHLPNGMGHPESAAVAGLTAKYIVVEVAAMASGARPSIGSMSRVAAAVTPEQLLQAATYFSALRPMPWITIVETTTAPTTYVIGTARLPLSDASPEPLGHRIIELPQHVQRFIDHDPHSGFVAYVPIGSITAGRALVQGADPSRTIACATCHGAGLHGDAQRLGGVPWIAGRSPTYVFRQLWEFKHGTRNRPADSPMKAVVTNLSDDQMIAIAAYLGTLKP